MAGACPMPGPDDPLVRGLLGVVDCNVQTVVQTGYASLFEPGGAFVSVLIVLMTLYVALVGFRLMRGETNLNVAELAVTAAKLGVVLALATQWGTYQALIYRTLFVGPEQVADVILHGLRSRGAIAGNVYDGLQRAFTDLTAFSPATPPGAPAVAATAGPTAAGAGQLSTLLSKSGFDSLLLLGSAVALLLSSLGVLLAAKVVLAILLAIGPVFIALLLFDGTRGLFEGWLRVALAFAFAPLAVTLSLGLVLTMLEPSLAELETMRSANAYLPGVAFGVAVLVAVYVLVSLGLTAAAGALAAGFRLPRRAAAAAPFRVEEIAQRSTVADSAIQPRVERVASAAAVQARRDAAVAAPLAVARGLAGPGSVERRTTLTEAARPVAPAPLAVEARIGQRSRRSASPRAGRAGPRREGLRPEGPRPEGALPA